MVETFVGFVAGLISTAVMTLTEYPIWRKWGMAGVSEWHLNQAIMSRFSHRPAEALTTPGLALHFLHPCRDRVCRNASNLACSQYGRGRRDIWNGALDHRIIHHEASDGYRIPRLRIGTVGTCC